MRVGVVALSRVRGDYTDKIVYFDRSVPLSRCTRCDHLVKPFNKHARRIRRGLQSKLT